MGETSAVLGVPIWIAQALMVPGFLLLAAAGFYLCAHRLLTAARLRVVAAGIAGMSGIEVGLVIFAVMLTLMVVRVPIGISMFIVGFGGYLYLTGNNVNALLNSLKNLAYARLSNYDLVVIPLFLLMGQFATHGGLSKALFRFVGAFIGHRKGGVAMAAIGACAGFGAICGSSVATAATMGQVALPELRRFGYSGSLATGALAAGGTLGIMIPPSVPLVIYAILTQESIGKLFMAAVLPGIIAMLGYMLVVRIIVTLRPDAGPAGPRVAWPERIKSLAAGAAGAARLRGRDRRHLRRLGESDRSGGDRRGGVRRHRDHRRRHARQGTHRQRARHGAGDRDDLPRAARRRHDEHDAGAVADARRARELGQGERVLAAAGDGDDPADLHLPRLRDGRAGDDPAHDPDLLPDGDGARLLGDERRRTSRSGSASWR